MINKEIKITAICHTINTRISDINNTYRQGPDLYFYKRVFALRKSQSIIQFLNNDYNIEILYATLVAWDMNNRGAKMKYYSEFKSCLQDNLDNFAIIEEFETTRNIDNVNLITKLGTLYDNLNLMRTGGRLVSNSKVLHFLFPKLLLPMDRSNTLKYFYNHTNESKSKYLEIMNICLEIMQQPNDWTNQLDGNWNTTIPKMIDNAIILLVGKSTKYKNEQEDI
jgi:hypothetical protein